MADNKKNKNGKGFGVTINISWVLYAILIIGLGWMLFSNRGTSAEKVEWEEVKTMILSGDVDEIVFVRNDYQGDVKIRPERLAKYSDKFPGGVVPRKSPHFYFLTSTKFDPETTFSELNESLDPGSKVKIVMRNNDHAWGSVDSLAYSYGPPMGLDVQRTQPFDGRRSRRHGRRYGQPFQCRKVHG